MRGRGAQHLPDRPDVAVHVHRLGLGVGHRADRRRIEDQERGGGGVVGRDHHRHAVLLRQFAHPLRRRDPVRDDHRADAALDAEPLDLLAVPRQHQRVGGNLGLQMLLEGLGGGTRHDDPRTGDLVPAEGHDRLRLQRLQQQMGAGRDDRLPVGIDPLGDVGREGVVVQHRAVMPLLIHHRQNLDVAGVHEFQRVPKRGILRDGDRFAVQIVADLRDQLGDVDRRGDVEPLQDIGCLRRQLPRPRGKAVGIPLLALQLGVCDRRDDGIRIGIAVADHIRRLLHHVNPPVKEAAGTARSASSRSGSYRPPASPAPRRPPARRDTARPECRKGSAGRRACGRPRRQPAARR